MSASGRYALLIVDLDGTLIDSFADIRASLGEAFAAVDVDAPEEVLDLCTRGVPLETYYRRATGQDPEGARFARFVDAYRRHYTAHQELTRVYPGVVETLRALRARPGPRLVVGSNKRTDMARSVLATAGLDGYFELIQGTDHVAKKPDPALFVDILGRTGVAAARTAVVGDTGADIRAAQGAGCTAIAATYGGWSRDELAALKPDHLIARFGDVLDIV